MEEGHSDEGINSRKGHCFPMDITSYTDFDPQLSNRFSVSHSPLPLQRVPTGKTAKPSLNSSARQSFEGNSAGQSSTALNAGQASLLLGGQGGHSESNGTFNALTTVYTSCVSQL